MNTHENRRYRNIVTSTAAVGALCVTLTGCTAKSGDFGDFGEFGKFSEQNTVSPHASGTTYDTSPPELTADSLLTPVVDSSLEFPIDEQVLNVVSTASVNE